jgi:hypothetical protein
MATAAFDIGYSPRSGAAIAALDEDMKTMERALSGESPPAAGGNPAPRIARTHDTRPRCDVSIADLISRFLRGAHFTAPHMYLIYLPVG